MIILNRLTKRYGCTAVVDMSMRGGRIHGVLDLMERENNHRAHSIIDKPTRHIAIGDMMSWLSRLK
jgi:hypothetical protein